jgi:hypothetical protein
MRDIFARQMLRSVSTLAVLPGYEWLQDEVPHVILCIFGISSWQSIHMSISSFHFFSTKYVFLQHAYWLIAAIAGCNQFKMSSCNHAYPGNTAKVDTDRNICLAKMSLIVWLQDDILNWLQQEIAAINQYECCKNTYFVEKKWKDEMDMCMLCHEEIPKMHKNTWGTSKNAQNSMRNFQKCTKSHEDLPKMHKIPWLTSNNAQNPMRYFQNVHNPMRNSQICTILW